MKRKKQIILLAHCILNVNSKVYGLAGYKSSLKDLVAFLMDQDLAMIQLPCPELEILGLKRWGHVKDQLDYPFFRQHCRSLLDPMIRQVRICTGKTAMFSRGSSASTGWGCSASMMPLARL